MERPDHRRDPGSELLNPRSHQRFMNARRQTHTRGARDAGFVETGSQVFIPSRGIHEAIPLAC